MTWLDKVRYIAVVIYISDSAIMLKVLCNRSKEAQINEGKFLKCFKVQIYVISTIWSWENTKSSCISISN
jgi:hypothetical protein